LQLKYVTRLTIKNTDTRRCFVICILDYTQVFASVRFVPNVVNWLVWKLLYKQKNVGLWTRCHI